MGKEGERILPDSTEIELILPILYKESRFRNMIEVIVLVIRKPEGFIVVLKKVP
jgi:hypothetical protein